MQKKSRCCYLSLHVFCGDHLLLARQGQFNVAAGAGDVDDVVRIAGFAKIEIYASRPGGQGRHYGCIGRNQQEDIMHETLIAVATAVAFILAASLAPTDAQAGEATRGAAAKARQITRMAPTAAPHGKDITSSSSSPTLAVGVNHPPKK
jgi:hypothetical protein